ncbi:hypothetical protein HK101_004839 [Irineochytrium annulatum]|nr:hypothetical protein HK101_004839 [Irineochytrium annulatum]
MSRQRTSIIDLTGTSSPLTPDSATAAATPLPRSRGPILLDSDDPHDRPTAVGAAGPSSSRKRPRPPSHAAASSSSSSRLRAEKRPRTTPSRARQRYSSDTEDDEEVDPSFRLSDGDYGREDDDGGVVDDEALARLMQAQEEEAHAEERRRKREREERENEMAIASMMARELGAYPIVASWIMINDMAAAQHLPVPPAASQADLYHQTSPRSRQNFLNLADVGGEAGDAAALAVVAGAAHTSFVVVDVSAGRRTS